MKKLKFRTNSRHISQLGRELMTDFVTALVELIKNSYDADAYGVKLIIDRPNTPESRIMLIDTGTGMTQEEFEKKWMVIGTNNKVTAPFTPNGRKKAGKKGIGRFSVERIAEKVNIYSFTDSEEPFKVKINWNNFEDINIEAIIQRIKILRNHEDSDAAKFIANQMDYFMITDKVEYEDKIIVENLLRDQVVNYEMFYNPNLLDILEMQIIPVLKKYEDIEQLVEDIDSTLEIINIQNERNMCNLLDDIYAKYELKNSKTGIILVMEGLRDQWRQKDIDKLQKELRLLVAPDFIDKDPFKIELVAPDFKIEDTALVNEILDLNYAKVNAKIYNNASKIHIEYKDKDGKEDFIDEELSRPYLCGDVETEIYFFLRDSNNLSKVGSGYNFRFAQQMLDTYCGIKIYRDNFRVKPFGDVGNDWLFLDQKKVKDTHGYLVGNNQVIGVIKISDVKNSLLIDATNREGIIENEAFDQLRSFITRCTNLISDVRRNEYIEEQKRLKTIEEEKANLDDQFKTVRNQYEDDKFIKQIIEAKETSGKGQVPINLNYLVNEYIKENERKKSDIEKLQSSYDKHYYDAKKLYQDKINFQESELNLYKNLASLGMLTGSFGHETSDIVSRIQTSIYLINLYLDKNMDKQRIKEIVDVVSKDFTRIYSYSNLIVNFLRKRKREKGIDINFAMVIEEVCNFYIDIVKSFGITLTYSCEPNIMHLMKQIDLESVIINMITNAFEQVKGTDRRLIHIDITQSISDIILTFEDSGAGIPSGRETEIFRPFETSKEDGIGLGLNIVKDIVESYNGQIEVEKSHDLGGAKFIVTLPKGGND